MFFILMEEGKYQRVINWYLWHSRTCRTTTQNIPKLYSKFLHWLLRYILTEYRYFFFHLELDAIPGMWEAILGANLISQVVFTDL